MLQRAGIAARLASLPSEARRLALAHLAHLAKQRRSSPEVPWRCPTCQVRVAALEQAIRQGSNLPEETCSVCDDDWQALDGGVPPGPPGNPVLPSRRRLLRLGMAELLERPVRDLPGDADLVRGFSIAHLVQRRGASEALLFKALHRTLDDKQPHQREEWAERVKILQRRLENEQLHPNADRVHFLKWCRGDLVDLVTSNVILAPSEIELLRQSRPELHEFACCLPETEHLIEVPS